MDITSWVDSPQAEFARWLVLSLAVAGFAFWGLKIIFREKNLRLKLFLPIWIFEYLRICGRPHSGKGAFFASIVLGYFWTLIVALMVSTVLGYYDWKFSFMPPVPVMQGSWRNSYYPLILVWLLGWNLIGAYSIRLLVVVTGKLEVLDKGLLQDRQLAVKGKDGDLVRKYELKELSQSTVRVVVDALIPKQYILNLLDALENATAQRIMRIVPEAGGLQNAYDVTFGDLKYKIVNSENGREQKVSAVTWDDMPKVYSERSLVMGVSGEEFVEHPIDQFSAMFVGGKPRSGKSVQLLAMIKSLCLASSNVFVAIIELQKGGIDFNDLLYSANGWGEIAEKRMTPDYREAVGRAERNHNAYVSTGIDSFSRLVALLNAEIDRRAEYLKSYGVQKMFDLPDDLRLPTIMVIWDEALTALLVHKLAEKNATFVKSDDLMESMFFRGGFVNIIFCNVYHEMTKETVGKKRDSGLIYSFNMEQAETEYTMKRSVTPLFGQGLGLYRDPGANVVGRYAVPFTDTFMVQQALTKAAAEASPLTVKENNRLQMLMYAERPDTQIYREFHASRMNWLANRDFKTRMEFGEKTENVMSVTA